MKKLTNIFLTVILCISPCISYSQQGYSSNTDSLLLANELYKKAENISYSNPDSAFNLFMKCKDYYTQNYDTTKLIQSLIGLSKEQKMLENYSQSYDFIWEALSLAENINNELQLYEIYKDLGMLYKIFEKEDEAFRYKLAALNLAKKLKAEKVFDAEDVLSSYFRIALHYRKTAKYEMAITYLDSCQIVDNSINNGRHNNGYIFAELGYLKMIQGDFKNAEELFTRAIKIFETDSARYLVKAYSYLGELKAKQNQKNEAILNYLKSLQAMDSLYGHIDLRPNILDQLSKLYFSQNKFREAYKYVCESKTINDSLFNVKNANSQLYKIRNKYNEAIEFKNKQLKDKEFLLVQRSQSNLQLKIFIFILLLLFAIVGFLLYSNFQNKKYLSEKREIELKLKHESEKAQEVLRIKNKELTASTLQLIDKDRMVNELLQYIKTNCPDNKNIQSIKKSITRNNQNLWDVFNLRFVAVNSDFYANLRREFPKLSPTERKYCALIKLRFSCKDMAQLLQISLESVHITRHRLRKKMNLAREASLSNYIAEI